MIIKKGLILTFGEQTSLSENLQMVSLLQRQFQVEKKKLYNSKITKFEEEPKKGTTPSVPQHVFS